MRKWCCLALGVPAMVAGLALSVGTPVSGQARSATQISAAIDDDITQLGQLMPDRRALEQENERAALAPKVIPVLRKFLADASELIAVQPDAAKDYGWSYEANALEMLAVLGDKEAPLTLAKMAASSNLNESLNALRAQLIERWVRGINDPAAQKGVVDDLEKLDLAHPESEFLTRSTEAFVSTAITPPLQDRLKKMALAMKNPQVARAKAMWERQDRIESVNLNKPVVLAGKTVDGKDFTTADWKGKVILVDFWATWCGPCVEEVPRVKQIYEEYHAEGLEVVGVSNDYTASALRGFVASNDLPWPELYDSAAADAHKWNPLTGERGIVGIPVIFLIDKKGVCQSVTAPQDMEKTIPKLLGE
jgi:thiol-disulfide isomerase/thioredoxin